MKCPQCSTVYDRQRHHAGNPMGICAVCRRVVRKKRVVLHRRLDRIRRDLMKLRNYGACLECEVQRGHSENCPVWLMLEAVDTIAGTITTDRKSA